MGVRVGVFRTVKQWQQAYLLGSNSKTRSPKLGEVCSEAVSITL
jgi:hypothetical protein